MRTTLNLDEDVLQHAKSYAEGRALPLGAAVSELIRRGLTAKRPTRLVHGLHLVDPCPPIPRPSPAEVSAHWRRMANDHLPSGRKRPGGLAGGRRMRHISSR